MIDPRKITPLLSNMTVDRELGRGPNGVTYLVTRRLDGKKMVLKHLSIPSSDAETRALIYAGAVSGEADAQRYYASLVKDIKAELLLLNGVKNAANILKFRGYQVDQKFIDSGYDVYLLADYCRNLREYVAAHPLTKLQAVNLAIDLCSGLEQLRAAGLVHKDIHPGNVYLGDSRHFLLGDLGVVKVEELEYGSMPDSLLTDYSAPEVVPSDASLSPTMDIYSVGIILYEIYNGGLLPVGEDGRLLRPEGELPAPAYADIALSDIILRACAYDPDDRYQTPGEMKQALVLYMQRGNISNTPLVPPANPEESDAQVDVAAIAATVEAGQAAEGEPDSVNAPAQGEELPDPGFILDDAVEDVPMVSLNDLSDDDLLVPTDTEISVEDFLASIRSRPGLEVVSMDDRGNTSTVPGYETEETLPEGTEFVDSADTHVPPSEEQEPLQISLEEGEAEPKEPEIQEAIAEEIQEEIPVEPPEEPEPVPQRRVRRRRPMPEPARNDDPNVYDSGYEEPENPEEQEEQEDDGPAPGWKKALIAVIVVLVLAGGGFTGYLFKTDTVKSVTAQAVSSSSVVVQAETKNGSAMEVVCSTATGEVSRMSLQSGSATFTDLNPSTTYTFTLKSTGGKLLLGGKSAEAKTEQMTNLTGFAASSVSAVTANLVISGTGDQPDKWVVTCTAENGDVVTAEATDASQPIEVTGLTPATTYTATISRGDGDQLGGTTTCSFTTMEYTVLNSFDSENVTATGATVKWTYTGTVPESWTVTCEGTDGSSTAQNIAGTECTLDGLSTGVTYTVTLSCPSLQETDLKTITLEISSATVTEIVSTQDEDGNLKVDWQFTSDEAPKQWNISYVYASENEVTPTLVTTDTNSLTLEDPVPNTEYTFTIESADDLPVGGTTQTTCVTGEAADFTDYGCSDAEMTLYALEDNPDSLDEETDTFTTSQHIAFKVEVNYDATDEDKQVKTLYVIRGTSGSPYYVYRNDDPGRSWSGSWTTARHTGDLPDTISKPGSYTLEVYFDGKLLASKGFTVTAE